MNSLSIPNALAFAALTLALIALWLPASPRRRLPVCFVPCALAIGSALAGGLIDAVGVLVLLFFAAACWGAAHARGAACSVAAHATMLITAAALFLHLLPGFDNPLVLDRVVLGPGSQPYTKFFNFDKGMAGLFLLGIYAAERGRRDQGMPQPAAFLWRFVVLLAVVLPVALALGYVRPDPKLPEWWPLWVWSMVFLTALPEEALFRGVAQTTLASWLESRRGGPTLAIVLSGVLFGVAHVAGGPAYVVLATLAGIGYGWVYAATRSMAAAIAAHAGLNTMHFLFFSYPALAAAI